MKEKVSELGGKWKISKLQKRDRKRKQSRGSGTRGDDIRESGTHLEFQEERRKVGKVFEGKTMETP